MTDHSVTALPQGPIPADDPNRSLTAAAPDDPQLRHMAVVGDTYILVSERRLRGAFG